MRQSKLWMLARSASPARVMAPPTALAKASGSTVRSASRRVGLILVSMLNRTAAALSARAAACGWSLPAPLR